MLVANGGLSAITSTIKEFIKGAETKIAIEIKLISFEENFIGTKIKKAEAAAREYDDKINLRPAEPVSNPTLITDSVTKINKIAVTAIRFLPEGESIKNFIAKITPYFL